METSRSPLSLPPGVERHSSPEREYLTPVGGTHFVQLLPYFEVLGAPWFVGSVAQAAAGLIPPGLVAYVEIRPGFQSDPWRLLVHACPGAERARIWRCLHDAGVRRQRWLMPQIGWDHDLYGILVGPASGRRLEVALSLLSEEHGCDRILFLSRGSGPDETTRAYLRRRAELVVERCDAGEQDHALEKLETLALDVQVARPDRIAAPGEPYRACIVGEAEPLGLFAALADGPNLEPFGGSPHGPRLLSPGALDVHRMVLIVDPENHRVSWREV